MGLDRLGILFIVIILPIALILNAYTNTQVNTLKMQLEYDSKLNACTADAVRTYQNNSLNEDASNLGDVRIGNVNAAINVFFTSLSSNLNMSGYSKQFLQEYVPAIVFTMYDGYYIYSKYTNTIGDEFYATQEEVDETNRKNSLNPGQPGYLNPSYYYGVHPEGEKEVSQQLYGLKPFVHYSCRYKKGTSYDFVVSYTLDNYITIQGIVDGKPVDRSGYLIDIDNSNTTYNSSSGTLKYRGVEITKESVLTENLIVNKDDGTNPETKSYPYHKVNGVKYYFDEGEPGNPYDDYWFSMLNGIKNNSTYTFDLHEDTSAYNYYVKAYEFSTWVKNNLSGITDNDAQVGYNIYDENGVEKEITGLEKTATGINIFKISGIEELDSNFNQHRRAVIRYTIERNLSIAIANYNDYSGTQGLDFRMPKFSEAEWDRIQQNMTVISYLQGLPIGTKIYNGVSVIPNNENEEVVSEQSIYIGEKKAGEDNYYYSVLTTLDNFTDPNEEFVGIYNVDLRRKEVEYNKQKYYYYPKLYFEKRATVVDIDAEKTDSSKNIYAYNGNIYKYIDEVLLGTSPDPRTTKYKLAQAFYTALGRERESRYNQRNNYEELLTMMSDEEAELVDFNAQFTKYENNNLSKKDVESLIQIAQNSNKDYNDANENDKWVIVRRAGSKTYNPGSICGPVTSSLVAGTEATLNDDWFTFQKNYNNNNASDRNYVKINGELGNANNSNQYPLNDGESFTGKCFYDESGRVRAVYILINKN